MDKNIAALSRPEAKTVGVIFPNSSKQYTYVTNFDVQIDDIAVVRLDNGEYKVVQVVRVDKKVNILPFDAIRYKWLWAVVDGKPALLNQEKNREIERDERIEASQERREDKVEARRESEEEFDFERDCGARP